MKLLVLLAACAFIEANYIEHHFDNSTSNDRIVGAGDIDISNTPWQVSIHNASKYHCGGAIISKDWIITSAKCMSQPKNLYTVRVGSTYYNSGGAIYNVADIIKHENFKTNAKGLSSDDIALVRLNTSIIFTASQKIIPLCNIDEVVPMGKPVQVSGWGGTVPSNLRILQSYLANVLRKINCNSTHSTRGGLYDHQSCIGPENGQSGACPKDAGGPVVYGSSIFNKYLVGVISWSEGCGKPNLPAIFTDVGAYRFWIKRHTGV
ncbi:trypsin-1-like [Chelonus insularis]|uniref:trypsin-1-like n=1 Tax=Chelonus insularis TaxID=460826 RepID=UPI00158EB06C|nr:trypsin-1-like [Chelonus insularis]